MQIERDKAVALFVALGLKNADKWNAARMGTKLSRIKDMVDEDVSLEEDEKATLAEVMAAIDAGDEIEVLVPESETVTVEADPAVETARGEAKDAAAQAKRDARAAAKAEKDAEKESKKAEREAARAAKKAAKKPSGGVRRTVFFVCGECIGKRGLAAGITDEMTAEVVAELRTDDKDRIGIDMRTAWHALAGYAGFEHDGEVPGVNTKMETRPGMAGALFRERGVGTEVKDLIAPLNERYRRENDTQSMYTLRNAKGAIQGYESVTAPAEETEAAPTEEPATEG
jgi:hypothetical protein